MEPNLEIPHEVSEDRNEKLHDALESIMTLEEYSKIENSRERYIFSLEKEEKQLFYYGVGHSRNPENPLFEKIQNVFNTMQPDVVIIEGISMSNNNDYFNTKVRSEDRDEIILKMGESGFTIKLALENNLPWHCPEPTDREHYAELLEAGFSKDEVFAWSIFRLLDQYNRQISRDGFEKYIQGYVHDFIQATDWKDFSYTLEHALSVGEEIYGTPIDVENDKHANERVDPIPWEQTKERQTVFNKISAQSGIHRDRKIVTDIIELSEKYNKLFIVYGGTHAVVQEPALRKFFAQ